VLIQSHAGIQLSLTEHEQDSDRELQAGTNLQQVAFVQEQDNVDVAQELIGDDRFPQQ
jgi:hypothetical protein